MAQTNAVNRVRTLLPAPFEAVRKEMDAMLDQFVKLGDGGVRAWQAKWAAPLSLWEEGDAFFLELDAPGVKNEDVNIALEKGVLSITIERKAPEGERRYLHQERGYGQYLRKLQISDAVNPDAVEAELHDGVLRIKLGKKPETQPKKIEVRS